MRAMAAAPAAAKAGGGKKRGKKGGKKAAAKKPAKKARAKKPVKKAAAKRPAKKAAAKRAKKAAKRPAKKGGGGKKVPGAVLALIDRDLGGFDKFRNDFIEAGKTQFGSGWAWLAIKDGKLAVTKTPNGENPLVQGGWPLLGVDVWEHSYYIDYRNERPKYLEAWFDHLINWEHVEEMLALAPGS